MMIPYDKGMCVEEDMKKFLFNDLYQTYNNDMMKL